jgi:glycosyltransferase involved in cell wall biosynthesis
MKIAHLVIGGQVGGGQLIALRLARGAQQRGDDALVVSPSPGPFLELAAGHGIATRVLPLGRSFDLRGAWRLSRLLGGEQADLLHTHTMLPGAVLGRLAGTVARVPVVSHVHTAPYFNPRRPIRAAQRALDNLTVRLCARVVAVSEDTRAALERQGYPAERIVVVPNGVDLENAGATGFRAELALPADAFAVGHIGRLNPDKGQRELIEALAALADGSFAVLIGGDHETGGAYERELAALARRVGVAERVRFVGPRADAAAAIAELDVLALPSRIEGFPLVLLEAMARGKPVVATPVGGVGELVVDGETGLLVQPGDVGALAGALRRLRDDPDLRARLGEAGRDLVAHRFSADAMVERVLEVYDEIAAGR